MGFSLADGIKAVEQWHNNLACKAWLNPVQFQKPYLLLIIGFLFAAVMLNVGVRVSQYYAWSDMPEQTVRDGTFLYSTADAPYFLENGRKLKLSSTASKSISAKLPEGAEFSSYRNFLDTELISGLISLISSSSSPSDLLAAGHVLVLVCSALTTVMIVMAFGSAGYWLEGAVASVGGGLSLAYLVRSAAGRIDTDMLNLGLMYLLFGCVLRAGRSSSRTTSIFWSSVAGFVAFIFLWWYGKSQLIWMSLVALAFVLLILRRDPISIVSGIGCFILISGVKFFDPLDTAYMKNTLEFGNFIFPNTHSTISELRTLSPAGVLKYATGSLEMGFVGIVGLAIWAFRHPIIAITYSPLMGFALLNFAIGNRAVFYSAPMIWFGAAFLVTSMGRYIFNSLYKETYERHFQQVTVAGLGAISLLVAWVNSPTDFVPRPSFSKQIIAGLSSLRDDGSKTNAVVASWWDYDYTTIFFSGLETITEPGKQTSPKTYFLAKALLHPDQRATLNILQYFASDKGNKIGEQKNAVALFKGWSDASTEYNPNIYLVVTAQMAGWMGSISQIGNWDIESGEPINLRGNPNGPLVNYERLNCRLSGYPDMLTCSGATFDLERGLVNGMPVLAGWAHSQDGTVVRNRIFDDEGDLALQIVQTGKRINVFLMHRQLFESSFNELYHLGQIDHPSITLYYDDYPHIRIYKIDKKPAG